MTETDRLRDARARYRQAALGRPCVTLDGQPAAELSPPHDPAALWTRLLELEPEHEPPLTASAGPLLSERALLGYAPSALLDGAWLAPWLEVRQSNGALGAALLEAFAHEVGDGDSSRHHGNLYRATLAAAGFELQEVPSRGFTEDARLGSSDLELALVGLEAPSLGFGLGVHAYLCRHGPPAIVRQVLRSLGSGFQRVHERGSANAAHAEACARRCLAEYAALPSPDWTAPWRGALALSRARHLWTEALAQNETPPLEQAMQVLIQRKAAHAHGYHPRLTLAGRGFDHWLDPRRLDAAGFLQALAASPYVVPGKPEESSLVSAATRFGGSMFGVFTDAELELVRRWIDTLPALGQPEAAPLLPAPRARAPEVRPPPLPTLPAIERRARSAAQPEATPVGQRPNLRQLYQLLLSPDREALPEAHAARHTEARLARSGRSVRVSRLEREGLWPYSPERLWAWIDRRHGAQRRGSVALDHALSSLSRQDTLWMLTQLAPAAFVDGAWLSGLLRPERLRTASAGALFRIYRDELGAGLPAQHHGNVLRRALAGAGVELPATGSREFAECRLFLTSSFSMPVYWLALARACAAFWPELLGLNLAVEIAGLGTSYERAAALMHRHGIDAYFFELHNAIDNPACGHTAWSGRAISLHMDELVARGDERHTEHAWQRIWRGFASYDAAARPLTRRIALQLGPKLLLGGLRSAWTSAS